MQRAHGLGIQDRKAMSLSGRNLNAEHGAVSRQPEEGDHQGYDDAITAQGEEAKVACGLDGGRTDEDESDDDVAEHGAKVAASAHDASNTTDAGRVDVRQHGKVAAVGCADADGPQDVEDHHRPLRSVVFRKSGKDDQQYRHSSVLEEEGPNASRDSPALGKNIRHQ